MGDAPFEALYHRIGTALVRDAPSGWTELRVRHLQVGRTSETLAWADVDGDVEALDGFDVDLVDALEELRTLVHTTSGGVWYTAHVLVTRDMRIGIELDYETEPAWQQPADLTAHREDLDLHPRDESSLPPWHAERLRGA